MNHEFRLQMLTEQIRQHAATLRQLGDDDDRLARLAKTAVADFACIRRNSIRKEADGMASVCRAMNALLTRVVQLEHKAKEAESGGSD